MNSNLRTYEGFGDFFKNYKFYVFVWNDKETGDRCLIYGELLNKKYLTHYNFKITNWYSEKKMDHDFGKDNYFHKDEIEILIKKKYLITPDTHTDWPDMEPVPKGQISNIPNYMYWKKNNLRYIVLKWTHNYIDSPKGDSLIYGELRSTSRTHHTVYVEDMVNESDEKFLNEYKETSPDLLRHDCRILMESYDEDKVKKYFKEIFNKQPYKKWVDSKKANRYNI